jgi:hypothetical protein
MDRSEPAFKRKSLWGFGLFNFLFFSRSWDRGGSVPAVGIGIINGVFRLILRQDSKPVDNRKRGEGNTRRYYLLTLDECQQGENATITFPTASGGEEGKGKTTSLKVAIGFAHFEPDTPRSITDANIWAFSRLVK